MVAGVLGLTTSVLLARVVGRLTTQPAMRPPDVSHVPMVTLLCFLLAGAAIAGIAEEASFRGYMQGAIERRHGPVAAIVVTTMVFTFAHSANATFSLSQVPFYLGVGATFGTLAFLTNSILPGMFVHMGAVVLDGLGQLARSAQALTAPPGPALTIWETGTDASFWVSCLAVFVAGAATIWAFAVLATVGRNAPAHKH